MPQIEYVNERITDNIEAHGAAAEVSMHISVKFVGDPIIQWHYYGTPVPAEHLSDPNYFQHGKVPWPSAFLDLTEDDQFLYYDLSTQWARRILET